MSTIVIVILWCGVMVISVAIWVVCEVMFWLTLGSLACSRRVRRKRGKNENES